MSVPVDVVWATLRGLTPDEDSPPVMAETVAHSLPREWKPSGWFDGSLVAQQLQRLAQQGAIERRKLGGGSYRYRCVHDV